MGSPPLGLAPGNGGLTRAFENHLYRANTTLIFLASCLLFAETTLGVIAGLTNVSTVLIASFALAALIVVVAALVIMYLRDPVFLTLSGRQAFELRRLEIMLELFPDQARSMLTDELASGTLLRSVGSSEIVEAHDVAPIEDESVEDK